MAIADIIAVIAPELVSNANLAGAIAIAETQIAADHCNRDLAVAYLTAHILTISARRGVAGSISSRSEGGLSVGYSVSADTDSWSSTSYGKELQRINRQCYALSARTGWIT